MTSPQLRALPKTLGHVLCCADHSRTLCGADVVAPAPGLSACEECVHLSFGPDCPLSGEECSYS